MMDTNLTTKLRDIVIKIVAFTVVGWSVSQLLERDVTYLWVIGAIGLNLPLLAWVTWPQVRTSVNKYTLAIPLFFAFLYMFMQSVYRWTFVALDRPKTMFDGVPYDIFIASGLGLLACWLQYLINIGHMKRDVARYTWIFWGTVIVPAVFAAYWYYKG